MIIKRDNTPDVAKVLSAENIKAIKAEIKLISNCLDTFIENGVENYPELLTAANIGELYSFCFDLDEEGDNWFDYNALNEIEETQSLIDEYYEQL